MLARMGDPSEREDRPKSRPISPSSGAEKGSGSPESQAAAHRGPPAAARAERPAEPPSDAASAAQKESRAEDLAQVERARKGDTQGFAALFEKYREKVYRVVYGYLHDKEDALDVTQEAFIKAFKNLEGFEGKSGFYTWLTQIAINLAIDARRKRARRKIVALEDYMDPREKLAGTTAPPSPERRLAEKEIRERYFEALEQISEKHRTVFLLHTVEGLAYKEIADTLDISIGTVMSRLHYARKHLQEILGDYLK
jgi:RNA polymerase sigma-70 factor (ECF subfamily)